MTDIQSPSTIILFLFFLLIIFAIAAGWLYLQGSQDIAPIPSPAEVNRQWEQLARAIEAGNQVEAESIAEWLEEHGLEIELEALPAAMGRFICAWCKTDLGPAQTDEDSHGVCGECKKTVFGFE